MVFTSIPAYLDPVNWQQQQVANHQAGGTSGAGIHLLPPPPPPPPLPPAVPQPHGEGGAGSIRPGSMADRARLANIPMPETALKCPRCESTNTKFCYFNNYSLSQPRHFCKTCRRYWTRGGALRNVPVGGGCRRNKRSKGSNSSKSSSAVSGDRPTGSGSTASMSCNSNEMIGLGTPLPQLRFMAPLHHLTGHDDLGLSYGPVSAPLVGGTSELVPGTSLLLDQWRLQQFPLLGGFDSSYGLYPFEASSYGGGAGQIRPKLSTTGMATQLASVKMEDSNNNNNSNQQEMNLSRQFLGVNPAAGYDHIHHYWNNAATSWSDVSSFSSSSTSNPL